MNHPLLKKYQSYRRLFPSIRLSWTLINLIEKNDWNQVWGYLLGEKGFTNKYMVKGKEKHEEKEILGLTKSERQKYFDDDDNIQSEIKHVLYLTPYISITIITDVMSDHVIADYKNGNLYSYYKDQLRLYWAVLTNQNPNFKLYKCFSDTEEKPDNIFRKNIGDYKITKGWLLKMDDDLNIIEDKLIFFDDSERDGILNNLLKVGNLILEKIEKGDLDKYIQSKITYIDCPICYQKIPSDNQWEIPDRENSNVEITVCENCYNNYYESLNY